ncbi:hypothetical protein [Mumia zhuanghuii]|uniref:hypothetical protein n=1 Tax=Mumia zhuanghuii TaxID=2585211 RepID=UPI003641FD1A
MRRVVRWLESGSRSVLLAVLAVTTLLRLPFLWAPLSSDEGGFLLVADQWGTTGGELYGNQWVDRPPGLLVVFRLADAASGVLGDRVALRLVALALALVAVAAAWYAGRAIAGARGAVAAAAVMAALTSTPVFSGPRLTTALPAVAFVTLSVALALAATTLVARPATRRRAGAVAAAAGVAAACGVLMKQNYVDGFVFAGVLWLIGGRRAWRLIGGLLLGAAVPILLAAVWAASEGPGIGALWDALYGFRERAVGVIIESSTVAPERRMRTFGLTLLVTGAALLAALTVRAVWRRRRSPVALATAAALAYSVIGIAGGGSWWRHYALQLAMPLALGAALAVRAGLLRVTRVAVVLALASTLVGVLWQTPVAITERPSSGTAVGEWIAASAEPGDTGFVAYGSPQVLRVAGLSAPYPYSWSLPLRVRDPDLELLTALLDAPDRPVWLVEMGSFTWWGIETAEFVAAVAEHYHQVADVCGHRVFLRNDVRRELGPSSWCPDLYGRTTSPS